MKAYLPAMVFLFIATPLSAQPSTTLIQQDLTESRPLPVYLQLRGKTESPTTGLGTSALAGWTRSGLQVGPVPLGRTPLDITYEFMPRTFSHQCQEFASETPSTHWYMVFPDANGILHCYLRQKGQWKPRAVAKTALKTGTWYRARVSLGRKTFSFALTDLTRGEELWNTGNMPVDNLGENTTFILCDEDPVAVPNATVWRNLRVSTRDAGVAARWQTNIAALERQREERLRRRRMLDAMAAANIELIPPPREIAIDAGAFRLPRTVRFACRGAVAESGLAGVRRVLDERVPGACELRRGRAPQLRLTQVPVDATRPECTEQGYRLTVSSQGIEIEATSERGFFYAAQTLAQLFRTDRSLPRVRVRDWPAIPERLVMVATSQGGFQVIDVEYWKRMIRELAAVKTSMIMPYFEGGTFCYEKYPFLAQKGRDGFTIEKGRILSEYARQHFIRLVPQQESLGHSGAIVGHKELRHLREGGSTFCSTRPEVFAFLGDLYDELDKAFPDAPYIHVGGDEFHHNFAICPTCKARAAVIGKDGLYAEHIMHLRTLLAKRKRGIMIWWHERGFTESAADRLAKDIVVFDWHYGNQSSYPSIERLQNLGFKQTWATPAITRFYSGTDDWDNTFGNLEGFLTAGAERNVPGCCTCTWVHGLWGGRNFFELNYYGLLFSAACAWNPLGTDVEYFQRAYPAHWFGVQATARETRTAVHAPFGKSEAQGFWHNSRALEPILAETTEATAKRLAENPDLAAQAKALLALCGRARTVLDAWRKKATRNQVTLDFLEHDVHVHEAAARRILLAQAMAAGDVPEQARLADLLLADYDRIIAMFQRSIREAGGGDCCWSGLGKGHVRFRAREGRAHIQKFRAEIAKRSRDKE